MIWHIINLTLMWVILFSAVMLTELPLLLTAFTPGQTQTIVGAQGPMQASSIDRSRWALPVALAESVFIASVGTAAAWAIFVH